MGEINETNRRSKESFLTKLFFYHFYHYHFQKNKKKVFEYPKWFSFKFQFIKNPKKCFRISPDCNFNFDSANKFSNFYSNTDAVKTALWTFKVLHDFFWRFLKMTCITSRIAAWTDSLIFKCLKYFLENL